MNCNKRAVFLFFMISAAFSSFGQEDQEDKEKSLDSGTIKSRIEYVIEESNRYQEYKVVKMTWLETLKGHVADSMKALYGQLDETRKTVDGQKRDIENLKNELVSVRDTLAEVNNEKNSIDFFNIRMAKSGYKSFVWSITAVLAALLVFFIFKFNRSNAITLETKKALSEVQEEFESFKKRSREREQVLKRELQDELNKRI